MKLAKLCTYSVECILFFSSDSDVCTFEEAFPEHQAAVNAIWTQRKEVNVDKVALKDVDTLLRVTKLRRKLKKITFRRDRPVEYFKELSSVIVRNCSHLEVLDIPELELSSRDVLLLCNCFTLKYINIRYDRDCVRLVEHLVSINPQLEGVCVDGVIRNEFFEKLPENLKELKVSFLQKKYPSFWSRLKTWRLEKLTINNSIIEEDILKLSKLTTLKYLNICVLGWADILLEALFKNNRGLEVFHLVSGGIGPSLKHIPPSLTCLNLCKPVKLDDHTFLDCIKTWNLQSLYIYRYEYRNSNLIMRLLEAAPYLNELHTDLSILPDENFTNFIILRKLKILHLQDIDVIFTRDYTEDYILSSLEKILNYCVNLEELNIFIVNAPREIFTAIATLPKLKKFSLIQYLGGTQRCLNYIDVLSKSKSLTNLMLKSCDNITGAVVLALIHNCRTLTKLEFDNCRIPGFHKRLVQQIIDELNLQNRKEILTIEFTKCGKMKMELCKRDWHPMLKLDA